MTRRRLDQVLVDRGLAPTRSVAKRLILAGQVTVNGGPAGKPGSVVAAEAELTVQTPPRFVSRGGEKLDDALTARAVDVTGLHCLDVGASTGGFVDCLLQRGAAGVVAVDVGYGQLAWNLRQDPRVTVLERTNARHMRASDLDPAREVRFLTMDVSFIGALKVLPALTRLVSSRCEALILVKPQFEAGPDQVSAGGVVRDRRVRLLAVQGVARGARDLGWGILGASPSPIRGPAGNWECFLHLRLGQTLAQDPEVLEQLEALDGD